jgi:hypothetical protein
MDWLTVALAHTGRIQRRLNMAKDDKTTVRIEDRGSAGQHGGNRGGGDEKDRETKSSQAAGKDPQRGKPDKAD